MGNKEYQKTVSSLFQWLTDNDRVNNDKTSKFFPNIKSSAKITAKEEGIAAGLGEVSYLIKKYTKLTFKSLIKDGSEINSQETVAQLEGKSHEILAYERTILNILQRMSGIATATNRLINLINPQPTTHNPQPFIAATRKTPWMSLDKKAVAVGGGLTHRLNLSDGILVKDNHLKLITTFENTLILVMGDVSEGSHTKMYRSMGYASGRTHKLISDELIEIEVETEKQARQVLKTFQQLTTHNSQLITHNHLAILLDNFSPQRAKQTLYNLKKEFDLSSIIFEASGDINEENIKNWANTGVDILSLGSLTHSIQATNLSLEF